MQSGALSISLKAVLFIGFVAALFLLLFFLFVRDDHQQGEGEPGQVGFAPTAPVGAPSSSIQAQPPSGSIPIEPPPAGATWDRPSITVTPGLADPRVNQDNIAQTICVRGYTRSVRPPSGYTSELKRTQLDDSRRGYSDRDPRDFEEDHLIPLEIGGDPQSEDNLWPEHWAEPMGARTKDRLENELHRRVCMPNTDPEWLSLKDAQAAIVTDWVAAYSRYVDQ